MAKRQSMPMVLLSARRMRARVRGGPMGVTRCQVSRAEDQYGVAASPREKPAISGGPNCFLIAFGVGWGAATR